MHVFENLMKVIGRDAEEFRDAIRHIVHEELAKMRADVAGVRDKVDALAEPMLYAKERAEKEAAANQRNAAQAPTPAPAPVAEPAPAAPSADQPAAGGAQTNANSTPAAVTEPKPQ